MSRFHSGIQTLGSNSCEQQCINKNDGGFWQTVMACQLKVIGRLYGLLIRDYWQTVHKICKRSTNLFLLADPWCSVQKSNCSRDCRNVRVPVTCNQLRFPRYQGPSLKARGQGAIHRKGRQAPLNKFINAVIAPVVLKKAAYFRKKNIYLKRQASLRRWWPLPGRLWSRQLWSAN